MLKVTKLHKEFQSGDSQVVAVNDVSFSVEEGKFVSIIGKSGSGKSTLLSLLGTLEQPTSGKIELDGRDVTGLKGQGLVIYRRKKIGFVFQGFNLIPNLSALENVMLPLSFEGIHPHEGKKTASEILNKVGISGDKQLRRPSLLSGGEQQRVAIARALTNQPSLVLADEPTGNLDSETGKNIFKLLHDLAKEENTTILVVTHDLSIAGKSDQTFKLEDGKLTQK